MPAIVSTNYLGNPEMAKEIRVGVERFFKTYPNDVTVNLTGSQTNDVWELNVTASDGRQKLVHQLHGHDRAHNLDTILRILESITVGLPSSES